MSLEAIDHVVVLMLENRSFDHILGDLSLSGGRPGVDGLRAGMSNPTSFDAPAKIAAVTTEKFLTDPHHGFLDVQQQLAPADGVPNQGFVKNYETLFPTKAKQKKLAPEIMHYQTEKTVPIYYALANEYAISDQYHCPVPSETWPNRVFASAATTNGRLKNGLPLYDLPTVFSRLRDRGLEWVCYNDQMPNLVCIRHLAGEWLTSRLPGRPKRFRSLDRFEQDCASGKLPPYSFIEPVYFFRGANDDHPPHDIKRGQMLMAQVYLALRRNEELWKKTMLLITTDEHGGFFDHVAPPRGEFIPAPALPSGKSPDFGFDFHQLGPRVPLIIASPWVSKRSVFRPGANEFFDHTSIIRTVAARFALQPLTARDAGAKDLSIALDMRDPRLDDQETFRKIDLWYRREKPKTLASGVEAEEKELADADPHVVAARIARDGKIGTLAIEGEVPSEFQISMQELAAQILADEPALAAEVQ